MGSKTVSGHEKRIAQALMAQNRYGKTLTQKDQTPVKPRGKIKRKGNPLKGTLGAVLEVKY